MADQPLAAAPQAGVFSGLNPLQFNASDPIVLFIIQVAVIISFCRIIAIPLGYIRQPRVIAEVIAGIILGPTVMGRIPGFKSAIFPTESLPFLNLVATLGLVFFLFQVGLEVDIQVIKKDWRKSVSVAVAGMALPFGLGGAVSVGLYKIQNDPSIPFGSFLLFLGVAMSITAFPVLARILAELKLLRTKVGAITMASGLINDCTAWVLLALVVALLNSSGGIVALYVFLTATAFTLFVIFVIGPLYRRLCIHTNSFEDGPSPLLMTVTLMLVLLCAFVTNIIGVHSIFGGFLAGVIIPHEHDLSIKITEKLEDMINIIFLPLYFTLSGLKTQIGLLDSGLVWGYVILVIFLACFGKIVGCTVAAKLSGMTTRESFAVGFLMNCKGLVELIVLNLGHDAGVLNDQVFVILVVMALVTTFMTTPVVLFVYPEWYQKQTAALEEDISSTNNRIKSTEVVDTKLDDKTEIIEAVDSKHYCIVTMLNRIESVSSLMTLIQLLKRDKFSSTPIDIHTLRLMELTQRTSVVMKYKDFRETEKQDPVLNVFRTFANLIGINSLKTQLDYCSSTNYIKTMSDYGSKVDADFILLPWINRYLINNVNYASALLDNTSTSDLDFVNQAFSHIPHCTVGLFIDRGFGQIQDGDVELNPHIVVAYREGSEDDKAALLFALRLQANSRDIRLTVIREGSKPSSSLLYATNVSIQQYSEDQDINTLFATSDAKSHVVCQTLNELSGSTFTKSLERPLDEHDLVILGRQCNDQTVREEEEYESALGKIGFEVLKNGTKKASILIIQSASFSKIK